MTDYTEALRSCMEDAGMNAETIVQATELCKNKRLKELVHFLRLQRCKLVEEMHESQRRVDRMDYLIRYSKTIDL